MRIPVPKLTFLMFYIYSDFVTNKYEVQNIFFSNIMILNFELHSVGSAILIRLQNSINLLSI